jgi:D-sedoheptulose 7-phosphate isomerase
MDQKGLGSVAQQTLSPERDPGYDDVVIDHLSHRRSVLQAALAELRENAGALSRAAAMLVQALASGNKALTAGNGGSAAEAQHFAAELVGRFKRDRAPYAALALTVDSSIITAVANDYGFDQIFSRQILAVGGPGDILFCFSTSGESENVIQAAAAAKALGMTVVAITGGRTCRLQEMADITIRAPVDDTAVAQELHMLITHVLCDIAETELSGGGCV